MLHEPAPLIEFNDPSQQYKARLGVILFCLYALVYFGFVVINITRPSLMELSFGGITLAVIYGFGLIIFAILLALIYNRMCSKHEDSTCEKEDRS